jgi:hypothetical protein
MRFTFRDCARIQVLHHCCSSRQAARIGSMYVFLPFSFDNRKSNFTRKNLILSYESMIHILCLCKETFSWFNKSNNTAKYATWLNFSSQLNKSLHSIFPLSEKNIANSLCKSYTCVKTLALDNHWNSVWCNSDIDSAFIWKHNNNNNDDVRSSIRNIGCLQIFSSLLGSWR